MSAASTTSAITVAADTREASVVPPTHNCLTIRKQPLHRHHCSAGQHRRRAALHPREEQRGHCGLMIPFSTWTRSEEYSRALPQHPTAGPDHAAEPSKVLKGTFWGGRELLFQITIIAKRRRRRSCKQEKTLFSFIGFVPFLDGKEAPLAGRRVVRGGQRAPPTPKEVQRRHHPPCAKDCVQRGRRLGVSADKPPPTVILTPNCSRPVARATTKIAAGRATPTVAS